MIFKIYAEAASYAKRLAHESATPVRMGRLDDAWVVYAQKSAWVSDVDQGYRPQPPFKIRWTQDDWRRREEELAHEKLERELRQREHADQKAYDEAITANIIREPSCEACDRPISLCRCSS